MKRAAFFAFCITLLAACEDQILSSIVRKIDTSKASLTSSNAPSPISALASPTPTSSSSPETSFSVDYVDASLTEIEPHLKKWRFSISGKETLLASPPFTDGDGLYVAIGEHAYRLSELSESAARLKKYSDAVKIAAAPLERVVIASESASLGWFEQSFFKLTKLAATQLGTESINFIGLPCQSTPSIDTFEMGTLSSAFSPINDGCMSANLLYVRTIHDKHWLGTKLSPMPMKGRRVLLWTSEWKSYFLWFQDGTLLSIRETDLLNSAI